MLFGNVDTLFMINFHKNNINTCKYYVILTLKLSIKKLIFTYFTGGGISAGKSYLRHSGGENKGFLNTVITTNK